jgi:acylphosphatase
MNQTQIVEQLKAGNVQAVIEALEADINAFEAWCDQQEETEAAARELSSSPELLEEAPW